MCKIQQFAYAGDCTWLSPVFLNYDKTNWLNSKPLSTRATIFDSRDSFFPHICKQNFIFVPSNKKKRHLSSFSLIHCVKGVHIQRFCGPHFPAFELNTEIYSDLHNKSPYSVHMQDNTTQKTPHTNTFNALI